MKRTVNTIFFLFIAIALNGCIIISVSPDSSQTVMIDPGATREFTVSTMGASSCAWTLDGVPLAGQTGKTFAYTPVMADAGSHTLDLAVTVNGRTESVHWSIQVSNTPRATWKRQFPEFEGIQLHADGGFVMLSHDRSTVGPLHVTKLDCVGGIEWQKDCGSAYGSSYHAEIRSTPDDGYIVASSQDDDTGILVRLDREGNVLWEQSYGGVDSPRVIDTVRPTTDGGYVVAGSDNIYHKVDGNYTPMLFKLDARGNIVWVSKLSIDGWFDPCTVLPIADEGYMLVGSSWRPDVQVVNNDIIINRLGPTGQVLWQQLFGGKYYDHATAITGTKDGGYVIAGSYGLPLDRSVCYVFKLGAQGGLVWERKFSKRYQTQASFLESTADGGFILGGWTANVSWTLMSTPGSGGLGWESYPSSGASYILKLDQDGNRVWERSDDFWPGSSFMEQTDEIESAKAVIPTPDGGYIVHHYSYGKDNYLLKLDANGDL